MTTSIITEVDWHNLVGVPMRYVSHNFFAKIENDDLVAPPPPSSYANIIVETPKLPKGGLIQVSHKIDFYNLWILAEKELLIDEGFEIIIKHKPPTGIKKLMASILPHLEYSVFNRGYLDSILDTEKFDVLFQQKPYIYLYDQERIVNNDAA